MPEPSPDPNVQEQQDPDHPTPSLTDRMSFRIRAITTMTDKISCRLNTSLQAIQPNQQPFPAKRILFAVPIIYIGLALSFSGLPQHHTALQLTTLSTLYGISILESSRAANHSCIFLRYPVLYAILAVLVRPVFGVSLWLAAHYIFSDPARCASQDDRVICNKTTRYLLPILTVSMVLLPVVWRMEGRLVGLVVVGLVPLLIWLGERRGAESEGEDEEEDGMAAVKQTVWGLVGIGALVWIYALVRTIQAPFPEICQVDLVGITVAVCCWVVLFMWDLKKSEGLLGDLSSAKLLGSGLLFFVVGGPGALAGLAWLFWEERFLTKVDTLAEVERRDEGKGAYLEKNIGSDGDWHVVNVEV